MTVNPRKTPVKMAQITINVEKTGEKLKQVTREKGYDVKDLVALTGFSPQAIYKWFNGRSLPSTDTLVILSKALDIEIDKLLVLDGEFDFYLINRRMISGLVRNHRLNDRGPDGR